MQTTDQLYSAALALPFAQRVELTRQLIDSISHEADGNSPLGASNEELKSRLDAIATGRFEAAPWREALAQMRNEFVAALSTDTKR
jgi:putative addiction module component (TIGR02574 family)